MTTSFAVMLAVALGYGAFSYVADELAERRERKLYGRHQLWLER